MATKTTPAAATQATLATLVRERDSLIQELEGLSDPPELAALEKRRSELEALVDGDDVSLGAFNELSEVRTNLRNMKLSAERMRQRTRERIQEARKAVERQARLVLIEETAEDFGKARDAARQAHEHLLQIAERRHTIRELAGEPLVEAAGGIALGHVAEALIALDQDREAAPHQVRQELGRYRRSTRPVLA